MAIRIDDPSRQEIRYVLFGNDLTLPYERRFRAVQAQEHICPLSIIGHADNPETRVICGRWCAWAVTDSETRRVTCGLLFLMNEWAGAIWAAAVPPGETGGPASSAIRQLLARAQRGADGE